MIKAILCGASGKMGGFVALAATEDGEIQIVAGVDKINNGDLSKHMPRYRQAYYPTVSRGKI